MGAGDANVKTISEPGCLAPIYSELSSSIMVVFPIILIKGGIMTSKTLKSKSNPDQVSEIKEYDCSNIK